MEISWSRIKEIFVHKFPEFVVNLIVNHNMTTRKLLNYFKTVLNHKILKPIIVNNYPYKIVIGTGPICNLHCEFCPAGQRQNGRKTGFLNREIVDRIIKELGHYLISVDLYNWGEPLLNNDIFDFIHLFKKANIRVELSSNLNTFNQKICKELVESGLDKLIISLDGCSQESVEKYQKGNDFKKVISNVKALSDYKKKIGYNHPLIVWRYVVNRFNENEISHARSIYNKLGFNYLELSTIMCDTSHILFWDGRKRFENVEQFLPKNEALSEYSFSRKENKVLKDKNCVWLWRFTTINWNGSISPCCALWDEKFDFGNIMDKPFKEIWNGKKYQVARKTMRTNKKMKPTNLICAICKKNKSVFI